MAFSSATGRFPLAAVFGLALLLTGPTSVASAAVVNVDLYVRTGSLDIDGLSLPTLCYTDQPTGTATLMGTVVELEVGDVLSVTIHNQDTTPHGFEIVGLSDAASPATPGGVANYEFSFPSAGTWLYRDPVGYPLNVGLGLAGAVVVHDPTTTYDDEFLWFLAEHNEGWLRTHNTGGIVDTSVYHPNYFTINGLSGGEIATDPHAHPTGRIGDNLLIRVINGGLRLHSIHFHGYHVKVIARNGENLPAPIEKDTIAIPVGETADFLMVPHQAGVFPIHDHVVLSVTQNGVYPSGMIVFTDIQP